MWGERAADGGGAGGGRGPYTYAAALRRETGERHHAAHNHSHDHSSGRRERYVDNSPQSRLPASVLREQEHYPYEDDSQCYQTDEHANEQTPYFVNKDRTQHHNTTYRYRSSQGRARCYNCGESNHRQSNCRFDHVVRCHQCHQ